jgi:hypothetical protein
VRREFLVVIQLMPHQASSKAQQSSSKKSYGWIPHNAGFGFLDIAGANVGVFASLDRF